MFWERIKAGDSVIPSSGCLESVVWASGMDGSPPLGTPFGMCAQQQMCTLGTGEWAYGFTSHKHIGEGSDHTSELRRVPTCLGWACCMAKVFARDRGHMLFFLLCSRYWWAVDVVKDMRGLEGAGKYRYRDSLSVSVFFFSLSLTFKSSTTIWTCELTQCFIGLFVELFNAQLQFPLALVIFSHHLNIISLFFYPFLIIL